MELSFEWVDLIKVVLLNLILSGDNSVVIALACRRLPPSLQKKAFYWGAGGAVVLKFGLMFVAASLLKIPFLQAVGGVLLVVIAVKLLQGQGEEEAAQQGKGASLWTAVKAIIVADVVMSLDNAVAVVAVAEGHLLLILIGLVLSTPVIIWGAEILTRLMTRFSLLIYGAAALLGATAGEMIAEDAAVRVWLPGAHAALVEALLPWLGVAAVLLAARHLRRKPVRMTFQEWKKRSIAEGKVPYTNSK